MTILITEEPTLQEWQGLSDDAKKKYDTAVRRRMTALEKEGLLLQEVRMRSNIEGGKFPTRNPGTMPEEEIASLTAVIGRFKGRTDEQSVAMLAHLEQELADLKAGATEGEVMEVSLANAKIISNKVDLFSDCAMEARDAQKWMARQLLDARPAPILATDVDKKGRQLYKDELDKHINLVRESLNNPSWAEMVELCHDGTVKKRGKVLVNGNVFAALEDKKAEGTAIAAARMAKAAANKTA